MATITVRNLDEDVRRRLQQRAARNGRSMESEARAILGAAVSERGLVVDWVDAAGALAVDLELPPRSLPREFDLS
ncbi:MAG: Arc family DNA-binding protein [Microbacterium hominis]|jgi:plasmid stability protein|uniref:FitA-like ribbon-helix-helix domain-containing protein n=1 Tax=Microbacterium TaxID=33882 RepID=UPI0019AAA373|nr:MULTISPECIES: Arc family DNA-binding protein [Microbacterium]MBD3758943.1 Arc family DNA-binding protein [Microbacterium sp.]MBZ6371578.1 Arc family DNA-binding protein [Microbacterium hominis]